MFLVVAGNYWGLAVLDGIVFRDGGGRSSLGEDPSAGRSKY